MSREQGRQNEDESEEYLMERGRLIQLMSLELAPSKRQDLVLLDAMGVEVSSGPIRSWPDVVEAKILFRGHQPFCIDYYDESHRLFASTSGMIYTVVALVRSIGDRIPKSTLSKSHA